MPHPSPPPWAPKRLTRPSRQQCSSSFSRQTCSHTHHCSCLMRQHGGDLDLLTVKVVSKSRVMWATSVPILVFLGLSVLNLGPMYATDRQTHWQTDVRQKHRLMPPPIRGGGIISIYLKRLCWTTKDISLKFCRLNSSKKLSDAWQWDLAYESRAWIEDWNEYDQMNVWS